MKEFSFTKNGDKILFVVALAVLAIGLFHVWRNSSRVIDAASPPVTIVFTQWWQPAAGPGGLAPAMPGSVSPHASEENILLNLIREFEDTHEGIRVILRYKSYEDLLVELLDIYDDNFQGDVLALDPLWISTLKKNETIEYASPPLLSFVNVLFYNIDILLEAGFIRPPNTRSEFVSYARTVAGMEGNRLPLVVDASGSRRLHDDVYPWIWSSGGQLTRDGSPQVNSPPVVNSLSFLTSLKNENLLVHGNKLEEFSRGNAAFMISSSRDIDFVRERLGDMSFDITNIPLPDNYAGQSYFGGMQWAIGINSASDHIEEARLFIDFLAERAHLLANNMGALPTGDGLPGSDPIHAKVWDIVMAWQPGEEYSALPWLEMEKIFDEELTSLFAGEMTAAQTAAAIQRRWAEQL